MTCIQGIICAETVGNAVPIHLSRCGIAVATLLIASIGNLKTHITLCDVQLYYA